LPEWNRDFSAEETLDGLMLDSKTPEEATIPE
jgi:hypothetical protein